MGTRTETALARRSRRCFQKLCVTMCRLNFLWSNVKGVAGRNYREQCFPDEGSLICPPGKSINFFTKRKQKKIELVARPDEDARVEHWSVAQIRTVTPRKQPPRKLAFFSFSAKWHCSMHLSHLLIFELT